MPHSGAVPTKDAEFNEYVNRVIPYMADAANQTRLGITDDNKNAMVDVLGDTSTTSSWNYVYPKAKDPDISTKTMRDEKNTLKKSMTDLIRAVYDDIPESALTAADRSKLSIPKRDTEKTKRPKITTRIHMALIVQPAARFIVECRVKSDSTRPSMHKDADVIEFKYKIGGDAPEDPKACPNTETFKKARFTLELEVADASKTMHCYARWRNNSEKNKSGPWTRLRSAVISD